MSELNIEALFEALNQVASHNLLTKQELKEIIDQIVKKTFHSKFDPDAELELIIDEEKKKFVLINHSKLVVEDVEADKNYRSIEIPLAEAKKINPNVKVGEIISEEVDFLSYSKAISQQIKQMITQNVKERKKEAVFEKHKSLKGEMIDVEVSTISDNFVIFILNDGTTAFMPSQLRNVKIPLKIGQKTKVFVEDVMRESKDSQILVSNGSKVLVKRILEEEVPEIADGIIEIMAMSRKAGERTKIAVKSNNNSVDPVGTIIGSGGVRINAINQRLEGEKLDIIHWDSDSLKFVMNAISPSKVVSIFNKKDSEGIENENHKIIIVPNKHKSLAIGKQGINAKLTAELAKVRMDILSQDEATEKGIKYEFNGNVTKEEIEKIESGLFQNNNRRQNNNYGNNNSHQMKRPSLSTSTFDQDIERFNEKFDNISNTAKDNDLEETFDIDDITFTEAELKQMEANFEFGDEIFENDEEWESEETDEDK